MRSSAKQILLLPALLVGVLLLISACENDINKIKEISAKQSTNPIDSTTGVDVIYSDSAKVKLRLTAPLMLHYQNDREQEKSYEKMPKGVKIVFFDTTRNESGNIVADSAIQYSSQKIIEFHKNVVATNAKGETFKSDELIWDQVKKIMYSNKPVQVVMSGGNIVNGVNFKSDEKLNHPIFGQSTGTFNVTDVPGN
ncbi:MAG TPA: LPS export ABC transporter periplasmic protein LptC [Mucilaginibacter sp.]